MITKQDFLQKIRTKYPGYEGVDDNTLYTKITEKYPEYKSQIQEEQKVVPLSAKGFYELGVKPAVKPLTEGLYEQGIKPSARALKTAVTEGIPDLGADIATGLRRTGADVRRIIKDEPVQEPGESGIQPGLLGRTRKMVGETREEMKEAGESYGIGEIEYQRAFLQDMGLSAWAGSEILADTFMSALKTLAPQETEEAFKEITQGALSTETGQKLTNKIEETQKEYERLKEIDPNAARDYKASLGALALAWDVVGYAGVKRGAKAVTEGIETGTEAVTRGAMAGVEGIETGVKKGVKIAGEAVESQKQSILQGLRGTKQAVVGKADDLGKVIEEKGYDLRNTLSGLEPNEVQALKQTSRQEFDDLLSQAKKAKESDYIHTPYHEGAKKASESFKDLETNVRDAQKTRVAKVKESGIEKIETGDVRTSIVDDIADTFNVTGATKTKQGIKYKTVKGRKSLLDEGNIKDYEAMKLLESVTQSTTPLEMMDTIKKMQNLIYDTNILNRVSKDMKGLVTRSIGKLNGQFKKQMGEEYISLLDDMAGDIQLMKELNRVFKAGAGEVGNRGELAMKRLASGTTTSGEARSVALAIKERTGIDLLKEARLRQLAMDIAGDDRGKTFFGAISSGKQGVLGYGMEKARQITGLTKEKTALKRAGTGLKSKAKKDGTTTRADNTTTDTNLKKATRDTSGKKPMDDIRADDKGVKTTPREKGLKKNELKTIKSKKGFINPEVIVKDISKLFKKKGPQPSKVKAIDKFDLDFYKKGSKIGEGTDRVVYDIGEGKVLKVAKNPRGIDQNLNALNTKLQDAGIIPKVHEVGKDFVVMDKVKTFEQLTLGEKKIVNSLVKDVDNLLKKEADITEIRKVLKKYGWEDIADLDIKTFGWGDIKPKNLSVVKGKPVLLDEGTINLIKVLKKYKRKLILAPAKIGGIVALMSEADADTLYSIYNRLIGGDVLKNNSVEENRKFIGLGAPRG